MTKRLSDEELKKLKKLMEEDFSAASRIVRDEMNDMPPEELKVQLAMIKEHSYNVAVDFAVVATKMVAKGTMDFLSRSDKESEFITIVVKMPAGFTDAFNSINKDCDKCALTDICYKEESPLALVFKGLLLKAMVSKDKKAVEDVRGIMKVMNNVSLEDMITDMLKSLGKPCDDPNCKTCKDLKADRDSDNSRDKNGKLDS